MESREKAVSYFLVVNGEKVEVSEKVYKAHRAEIDIVRYRARFEKCCAQPNRLYCSGDCLKCRWHISGCLESYEGAYLEHNLSLPTNDNVETEVLSKLTMQKVYQKADELVKDGAVILQMRFEQQLSAREIAKKLGVSHFTINSRIKLMLTFLRKHYKKFF